MRILVTGDSVSAGEWDVVGDRSNIIGINTINSHRGVAEFLSNAGHEVFRQSFPGGSNALAIDMLCRDKPAYLQPEYDSSTWGPRLCPYIIADEFDYDTEPYRNSLDVIVFFWTGPLRSIVDSTQFDLFLESYQSQGAITWQMMQAWNQLCIHQDLFKLIGLHNNIILLGGQEDLPEIDFNQFADSGLRTIPSLIELCYPELDRPEWMDTVYFGWGNNNLRLNKGLDIKIKYTGSRYDEKTLDVLIKSVNFWKQVKNKNTVAKDAHPDRKCHEILANKILEML